MGAQKRKAISQEEIWDDSALVEHWDEALKEYEQYHSIHARGENVKDVLRQAEFDAHINDEDSSSPSKQPKLLSSIHSESARKEEEARGEIFEVASGRTTETSQMPANTENPPAFPSGAIASTTGDESMQNLMMSWYWAGYYTGFYQGQNCKQNEK